MKYKLGKIHQFWEKERNLLVLLVILSIHMFVIIPFGQKIALTKILGFSFYAFLLVAAWRYLALNTRFGKIMIIITIAIIVLLALGTFRDAELVSIISYLSIIFYCGVLGWIVLLKTFSSGPITIYRIEGSIVVYLLLGLVFGNAYTLIFHLYGDGAFKGLSNGDLKEFLYFSLTSLTTMGYGDITPSIPIARSLANLEGLMGQLYPAILIARLVSMEFSER